eukprot:CAMPEP_0202896162 /NCGR_PEP_ID=MMETSP1392-20130828/5207_1 /ASSEMBLY_ACC=CAM_ASM_000868 /TAXON_ID=225041 /ORGANISM="Chlamydomonas chlamydogama, Strain SAG 11-48b" /LENGTH=359 /DNA_ID=CAMNT_0049581409 /DNA_START=604 /DNA_END=1679 /DNA_ORIENTATION=-
MTFPDGSFYEGQWIKNEIQGEGRRTFANGNEFVGAFQLGEMHGYGSMTYASGDRFEGSVVHNVIAGTGTMHFANGDLYEGDFTANKMTGKGVMHYACGDRYEGDWLDGKRSGIGVCSYHNGDHYEGQWEGDAPHGEGRLQLQRAALLYEGLFVKGVPSQVPVKLNLTFLADDALLKGVKKPAGAKGAADEAPPPLPVALGSPLPVTLTVSAQREVPLPDPPAQPPSTPTAKGAKPGANAAPPRGPLVTEPASAGKAWETAEMESNRTACVTLHPAPPAPLPEGRLLAVCLASLLLPGSEEPHVRLLILPVVLEPPLPMSRAGAELVHGLEVVLQCGRVELPGLVIGGAADDAERLAVPG